VARGAVQLNRREARRLLVVLTVAAAALGCTAQASATSLTPGDVVVERDGNGGVEALTSSATPVYLNEFQPTGALVTALALPTAVSGSNKPLLDSGTATSDGELTLSENDQCVVMFGYDVAAGIEKITESKVKEVPRTVALVNEKGEINSATALTNVANEGNTRGATSSECTKIWTGSNGNKSTGGVNSVSKPGESTGTELNETDKNVRAVEAVDGQLYVSADPEQQGVTIAKVGSGLPTTKGQTITNLPFETGMSPEEPYGFSLLTLGMPSGAPDTLYVADNKRSKVVKYGLSGGKWVEHGAVEIPAELTGVTANDVAGAVTIYATSSGGSGKKGTLYRISDVSGVNGALSGIPVEVATAPTNEAFRGVAFAPGTTIGSGGTPPPAPTISAAETALPAALEDPTNQTMPITVGDSGYAASELTVSVTSSKESVAPVSGITVSGSGSQRTLSVTPGAVGESKITLTVEAPDGVFTSTQIKYGVSAYEGDPSDRYYSGAADSGASIEVGGGYMIVAGDGSNVLNLYRERTSGPRVKTFDFDGELPYGAAEVNIHSLARAGNTLYFVGSLDNTNSGEVVPSHDTIFAAEITGSGASTELTYLGSYLGLKEDLTKWDETNGEPLGLAKSAAPGQAGESVRGFKVQGVEFLPGSSTEAYLAFRAPEEPDCTTQQETENTCTRDLALVIPVTNFSSLFEGNPETSTHATFGAALEWNLGGLSIRQIRKNAAGEYVIITSTANSSDTIYQLWGWDGEPEDEPVLLNSSIPLVAEGVWDSITSVPEPIASGDAVELLQDDSKVVWYGPGTKDAEKGLTAGLQKSLGRLVGVEIPAPGTPNPPHLAPGSATPNKGEFTLRWKPAPTLRARFTLQHQNALGGWSTVASGLSKREYTFAAGSPEGEGTWNYRVSESNETGESGYSAESAPIKVDKTPPYEATASATRPPDYAGKGGWYENSATVSFTANGDPVLSDGSPGSGVNPATLTGSKTFETSGSHEACGTVADYAANVSTSVCVTVQVEATPPNLEIECPATAVVNEAGVTATVTASDQYSGLASDPSGAVSIDTSSAGPQTVTRTAVSNVGLQATKSCTTEVVYPTPGAPALTAGASPNNTGLFTLGWTGDSPLQYFGLSYTLQEHNAATPTWTTAESGIDALSYEFSGAGEQEGTWVFRVQAADSVNDKVTEYSPVSPPVVVDKTAPYAPSATASRSPDYAGNGGWYKNSVTVSFASSGDRTLSDGSPGSGVNPASIPTPQTFTTSGFFQGCGTVTDYAGNVSEQGCRPVQVEATPPELEISCPETVLAGQSANATVTASDRYSGLASDPSGTVPIDTSSVGPQTVTRTAVSNLGFETKKSCTTMVESSTPGAPALTHGSSPNKNGHFTLGWSGPSPVRYFGLSYTLQAHNHVTNTWSTVASGIEALSYQFSEPPEEEGTWLYRVQASDPSIGLTSEYSPESASVLVDETAPHPPSATASRAPDYAGGGGWYKNSAAVGFTSNGDPTLSDGSAGSGVDPASLPASQTFSTSGSHTACGTVTDNAGNVSAQGCLTVQVDATPPSLTITCPATAAVGEPGVTATFSASDGYSGLATNPSGSVPINTGTVGTVTTTSTAISNVGLETTKSCTTQVVGSPPELGRCVPAATERVGKKTVYKGSFTTPTCVKAKRGGRYEWKSGVQNTHFTSSATTGVALETIRGARVACTHETSTGEYRSPRTVRDVILTFASCELVSVGGICTSPGAAAGEVVTKPLEGALGIDTLGKKPATNKIGVDLYPAGNTGPFMEFSCASTTVSVRGSVIVPIATDKMLPALDLQAEASGGKQIQESFVGGSKDILEESVSGAPFQQAALTVAIAAANGEDLELNSVT
jgi:hypothetical protein